MDLLPSRDAIESVRHMARERIRTGELPDTTRVPESLLSATESRLDPKGCRVCKQPIQADELLGRRLELRGQVKPELHAACHVAWHVEVEVYARVPVELMLLSTQNFAEGEECKRLLPAVEHRLTTAGDLTCQPRQLPINWGAAWGFVSPGYIIKLTGLGVGTFGTILAEWIGCRSSRVALIKLNEREIRVSSIEQVRYATGTIKRSVPPAQP